MIALVITLISMTGSLYFSEGLHLIPCLLCWYQRIAMYPLVAIFAVAIVSKSSEAWRYAASLILIGWLVASYHILLVYNIIPEVIVPCQAGVSCAQISWSILGFITIPLLSWLAFTCLGALYFLNRYASRI